MQAWLPAQAVLLSLAKACHWSVMVFLLLFLGGTELPVSPAHRQLEVNSMTRNYCSALLIGLITSLFSQALLAQTIVCVNTNLDTFCMKLLQADAPLATANFLRYVDNSAYTNTLIHQSVRNSYLLGGSWQASLDATPVVAGGSVANEFKLPNTRGTVALVTPSGQPNGATSGWRINVADNSATFSKANSGAVFAQILGDGMAVVDRLSKLSVHAVNNSFLSQAPMLQLDNKITVDDLVQVKQIYRYAGTEADFELYGTNFPFSPTTEIANLVCMDTNQGELCIKLYTDTPITVANFLSYVRSGAYDHTVIHRSVTNFVVQGGGFSFVNGAMVAVPASPAIVNESLHNNARGTIAMAMTSAPNSATSQWFINEIDNTSTLNNPANSSGAFSPFGEVISSELPTLDAIASISPTDQTAKLGATFSEIPLIKTETPFTADDFITINRVYETQREIPLSNVVKLPLDNVVAMATYGPLLASIGARFPVHIGNKLYMVILNSHVYTADEITNGLDKDGIIRFDIDTSHIIQLIENGRIAATFDGQNLTIPTVRIVSEVYANVTLKLINPQILEFQLMNFEPL